MVDTLVPKYKNLELKREIMRSQVEVPTETTYCMRIGFKIETLFESTKFVQTLSIYLGNKLNQIIVLSIQGFRNSL